MYGVVAVLGNAETVADNLGETLQFLATGPGVLSVVSVGVLLILWALVTQSPETDSSPQAANTPDTVEGKEVERLNTTTLAQLRDRNEQLEQLNANMQAERETVSNELQRTKRENVKLKQELEHPIELGDTARLFLTDGSRFVPDDDAERRTIFLPALLEHWAGPLSSAVEAGRTFVARRTEFDNCDIYGPGVFVLAEGSVENTFHKCDWEEEWRAFWPATKPERYVGVVALENCIFRRCSFKGVAFVVKPDEYRRLYRRLTGDDL
jgi:hypothetical protein